MIKQRNIKLVIEYDGTNYCGWQSQNGNHPTVQDALSRAIQKVTCKKVTVYGASRTDSGVHSIGQTANFTSDTRLTAERLRAALNGNLPPDIVVKEVRDVSKGFNARKWAKAKTYLYVIINGKTRSALRRNFAYWVSGNQLDLKRMRKAAYYLVGRHDFRSFTTEASKKHNCIREIYSLTINRDKEFVYIKVRGNGFLYNMVRTIVGTLLMVGQKKIPPEDIKKILESADRKKAGANVPPQGLCLMKVEY